MMSKLNSSLARAADVACIAATVLFVSGCCQDGFRTDVETIPRDQWLGLLAPSFSSTQIRLNNYTPERFANNPTEEFAYVEPDDSQIDFFVGDDVFSFMFDIPVIRREPSSIYVQDINAQDVILGAGAGRATISIVMESDGRELWTNCIANAGCFAIGDRDVNADDMVIDIGLALQVEAGRITYDRDDIEVEVTADITISGCNDDFFAFLCDLFRPDRENEIKTAIADAVRSQLRNGVVRAGISASFDSFFRNDLDIQGEITGVTVATNGNLLVNTRVADATCE